MLFYEYFYNLLSTSTVLFFTFVKIYIYLFSWFLILIVSFDELIKKLLGNVIPKLFEINVAIGDILKIYVARRPAYLGEFIKNALLNSAWIYLVDCIVKYEGCACA